MGRDPLWWWNFYRGPAARQLSTAVRAYPEGLAVAAVHVVHPFAAFLAVVFSDGLGSAKNAAALLLQAQAFTVLLQ